MMDIVLTFGLAFLMAWPTGHYMAKVFAGEKTMLDTFFNPIENLLYKLIGIRACCKKVDQSIG